MKKKLILIFAVVTVILFSICSEVFAEQQDPNKEEDFFEMSLEELMEVPVVVSASRQPQKISELSVPVSVITSEDIHYSGLTTIPEILQFTPGVDVVRLDRNRYAVGIRGLHEFASDRTLTLINGRIADSPFFGGSEFFRLPILIEDIERIEVVRGPGGAAWGANAFTGVINIITKKPEDVLGYFSSTTINEFGDWYTHLRLAEKNGKWSWRVSAGYEDLENSDEAGAGRYKSNATATVNGLIGYSGFSASDFSRNWRFDTEAIYSYSDQTILSFGAGYSHDEFGNFEFGGFFPAGNTLLETIRPYARIDHTFDDGSSGYLQWFSNITHSRMPSLVEWSTVENDIEVQLNFNPVENHSMSVGGNVRFIRVGTETHDSQDLVLHGEPYDEQLAGLFLIDRWQVTDRLTLESQIRGDWYSETQTDWSTRVSALYALDEQKDHVLRFSFAKAFRAPMSSLRQLTTSRIPLGGGLFGFDVLKPGDLDNEETWSLEGGYTGKIAKGLTLKANAYYQRFEKMIGYTTITDELGLGRGIYKVDNIDGADSYGVELEIEKRGKFGKLSAWYAYNDFHRDQANQDLRAYGPAKHKAGLTGRLFLSEGWALNANYRYTNTTGPFNETLGVIGQIHRLDLAVAKEFAKGNGEIMFGVSNVLNKTDGPHFAMGQLSAHETPGRMFFARLQYRF